MVDDSLDGAIRSALFTFLDGLKERYPTGIPQREINRFVFQGENIKPLLQQGIRKVAGLSTALVFYTTYTSPSADAPYNDHVGADGFLRYKWQGDDPNRSVNSAMRSAIRTGAPLVYFHGVADAVYAALYPAFIIDEEQDQKQFVIAFEEAPVVSGGASVPAPLRRYNQRLTRYRLHQPIFRRRVLDAYRNACAVCRLAEVRLLDAAHIIGDGLEGGDPEVSNGLAMCKIHHAAFDQHIIGVRPDDFMVQVQPSIMEQSGDLMLQYGLQAMHGRILQLPRMKGSHPSTSRLERRFREFLERGDANAAA
ncbi:MAG: HNH endonuclease [Gemmatimonadaceae bacterium]|nr:HNH endonuclease [Gemmatimonadaceae bacterium]NUT05090.1 HNH endonuclease [Hamadaea sp.]